MRKRLIVILALAFVVGIAVSAFAEVQNVKVSGDLTVIGALRQLTVGDNYANAITSNADRNAEHFMASILRVRVDADLTDNVMATVRLLNERYWGNETDMGVSTSTENTAIDLDLAYATLKEFLYSPLTLTVGRQELHFGNDMIVGAVATNNMTSKASAFYGRDADLSVRKSFDAIRATLNYNPLMIDVVVAKPKETTLNIKDDTDLYGVNVSYDVSKKTNVQAYWWLRDRQAEDTTFVNTNVHKNDLTHVVGVLAKTSPIDNLSLSAEGAMQLGDATIDANGNQFTNKAPEREAYAAELAATYVMPKMKMTPSITGLWAYFSGQHGDENKKVTAWDPMYENQCFGHIANALLNQSNAQLLGAIATAKPMDDVTLKGEYYAFWADKRYGAGQVIEDVRGDYAKMSDNKFLASEVDLTATYDYTEDVQFSLMGGMLAPGAGFDKSNRKLANEVIGSMKVTF